MDGVLKLRLSFFITKMQFFGDWDFNSTFKCEWKRLRNEDAPFGFLFLKMFE